MIPSPHPNCKVRPPYMLCCSLCPKYITCFILIKGWWNFRFAFECREHIERDPRAIMTAVKIVHMPQVRESRYFSVPNAFLRVRSIFCVMLGALRSSSQPLTIENSSRDVVTGPLSEYHKSLNKNQSRTEL